MKKRNNDVFPIINKNNQFLQKTKIDENSDKEKWQLKNSSILYANERI